MILHLGIIYRTEETWVIKEELIIWISSKSKTFAVWKTENKQKDKAQTGQNIRKSPMRKWTDNQNI